MVNGTLMPKFGYYMPWYLAGGVIMAISSGLMYTVNYTSDASKIYGFSVMIGIGTGLFCQASFSVAQAVDAKEHSPSSVCYIVSGQTTGMVISVTVANSIFLNEAEKGIANLLPHLSKSEIQNSIRGHGSVFVESLPENIRDGVLDAVVSGLQNVYILVAVAGAVAVVCSLAMKRERVFE